MKISSVMLGITVVLLFWMTAAFLRPVPTNTYEHYAAETSPALESTAQFDAILEDQVDANTAVK